MMHNLQLLLKTVSGSSVYVSDTRYTAEGQVDYRLMANGNLKTDYTYYSWATAYQAGKLWQLTTRLPRSPAYLQNLTYDYDDMGNVETILDTVANPDQTQTFLYDDLNRLTSAQANGGNGAYGEEQYAYSTTSGNLSQKAGVSYTYTNGTHRVTQAGGVTYGYDANGNMTSRVTGGITYTLTYDLHNRLTSISGNGPTSTFVYDSDGNRIKGTVNGVETTYLGSYYEKRTSDNSIKTYYYAGGMRVAMNETSQVTKYMIGDHLGSTSLMVTASGTRVAGAQYEAWGENRGTLEDLRTTFRFTGQRKEDIPGWGEGLYFYNARWYDPALSRFLSADSIIPNGWDPVAFDRYAYVRNSPAMYTDPSGHDICHGPLGAKECADAGGRDPDYVNPDLLSDGTFEEPGGQELYWLYVQMWYDREGYWWEVYGADLQFSVWDFIAVIFHIEIDGSDGRYGVAYFDLYMEGMVRQAYQWCDEKNYDASTPSGALNWLVAYSQVARERYQTVASGTSPSDAIKRTSYSTDPALKLANAIRDPSTVGHPEWTDGWAADRPYGPGNASKTHAERDWFTPNQIMFWSPGKDPLIILTGCGSYVAFNDWSNFERNCKGQSWNRP